MCLRLCGEPPFVSKTKSHLLQEIMNKEVTFTQPIWATVSDAGWLLSSSQWCQSPAFVFVCSQIVTNKVTHCFELVSAAKNLLTCLLKVDPAYRVSPKQLLETPWITVRKWFYRLHSLTKAESREKSLCGLCSTGRHWCPCHPLQCADYDAGLQEGGRK